jgi:hypothetical protein
LSENVLNDLNILNGLNELRPKSPIHHRRRKLPKTIDILKPRFAQPRQLFFEYAVVVRTVVAARRRRFGLGQIGLAAARLSDIAVEIFVPSAAIASLKLVAPRTLSALMKPPARTNGKFLKI